MACVTLRSAAVISINYSQALTLYYNKISTELIIAMDLFAKDSSAHPWPVSVTS